MTEDPNVAQAGGPGAPAPAPAATPPSTTRVKIGGQEFELSAEVAQALQTRETDFQRKLSEQGEELGRLRRQVAAPPPPPAPPGPGGPNLEVLWFENPAEAASLVERRVVDRLRGEYLQDQQRRAFWDEFYREHKDLADETLIVNAVYQRHLADLAPMRVSEGSAKLADLARREILRIAGKTRGATEEPPRGQRERFESPSGERPPARPAEPAEDRGPKSLTEVIRLRRKLRHEAQAKVQAGGPGA